jgi:hypothetical protein
MISTHDWEWLRAFAAGFRVAAYLDVNQLAISGLAIIRPENDYALLRHLIPAIATRQARCSSLVMPGVCSCQHDNTQQQILGEGRRDREVPTRSRGEDQGE